MTKQPELDLDMERDVMRTLDLLSAYIVVAGGGRISTEELDARPLGHVLRLIYPHKLRLGVAYLPHMAQPITPAMDSMRKASEGVASDTLTRSDPPA